MSGWPARLPSTKPLKPSSNTIVSFVATRWPAVIRSKDTPRSGNGTGSARSSSGSTASRRSSSNWSSFATSVYGRPFPGMTPVARTRLPLSGLSVPRAPSVSTKTLPRAQARLVRRGAVVDADRVLGHED